MINYLARLSWTILNLPKFYGKLSKEQLFVVLLRVSAKYPVGPGKRIVQSFDGVKFQRKFPFKSYFITELPTYLHSQSKMANIYQLTTGSPVTNPIKGATIVNYNFRVVLTTNF